MAGQVGWKSETTWGTGVTVDTFVPVVNWTTTRDPGWLRPAGIRAGRRTRPPGQPGALVISGSMESLPNRSIAALLKHCFGAVATTGAGPTYTHEFTPGPQVGKSLTVQAGVEAANGTTYPFTYTGVKIGSWSSAAVGEFAMLNAEWTGRQTTTATALASASYVSTLAPFTFVEGSVTVAGAPVVSANSCTLSFAKGLRDTRHVLGQVEIREQLEENHWEITSSIEADFDDLTLYTLSTGETQVESVFEFDNGADTLTITCSGQVTGEPPSLTKIGLESQTITLEHSSAVDDATTITAVLVNTEASAA